MLRALLLSAMAGITLPGAEGSRPVFNPADFQLDPRLEMTLWAAEPDVVDPVAICWDESGRVYVAECRDYPYGVGPDGKVGSTIRLLEDRNGDGRADRSTVFAGKLSYVTSLTPWRGGVLVAAAPDILFLKDTDGDDVADVREVVLTGFQRGVSDSLVNGLRYGLDHRIHGANGGNGGRLSSPLSPEVTVPLRDSDFAFDPATGGVELTGGTGGGFGLVFDDFGRTFTTYNIDHLQHAFLSRRQAERFPGFPPVKLTGSISDHGEMARIFPVSPAQTRPNHPEQAGHFSAAGGMGFVGSEAFPEDLRGSLLVCDVVGNLVHRDVLVPDGPVFRATRAPGEQTGEFLASRDVNFRPVGLEVGPDGALYLLDMQRDVIEHPDYIPAKLREKQDIRAGDTRGRIYRITPQGGWPAARVDFSRLGNAELIRELASGNHWRRLTAQRLLIDARRTARLEAALRVFAQESPRAVGRVHALWTLEGRRELQPADVRRALADVHPGVRENALWLAERHLPHEELGVAVLQLARDPVPRVRFVAAQVAGAVASPQVPAALFEVLRRDAEHSWSRRAVWSSLPPEAARSLVSLMLRRPAFRTPDAEVLAATWRELADLVGARAPTRPDDVAWLLEQLKDVGPAGWQTALFDGLADGLERAGARPAFSEPAVAELNRRSELASPDELRALWRVTRALGLPENARQLAALAEAARHAGDPSRPVAAREADIRLLGLGGAATVTGRLLELLDAREPAAVQTAALAALRRFREPELGAALVARWRTLGPAVRPAALNLLLERRAFHGPLLDALEAGAVTVGELNLDLEQRRRLLRGGTEEIRARAAKFMGDEEYSNRQQRVDEWLVKLPAQGDPARGRLVFLAACAQCHVAGADGQRVGPDLTAVAHRSVEDLLSNILDPNMAINPGFVAYTAETNDGEAVTGLLHSETADTVVLLQAAGQRQVISRRRLRKLESAGLSLMPEGLEAGRTPEELRDLIAFLQGRP